MQDTQMAPGHLSQAANRDTPPEDVHRSRQVSWLAGQRRCLAFPAPCGASDTSRQRLAAYSCGGSPGFAMRSNERTGRRTEFPLHSKFPKEPGEPRRPQL